MKSFPVFDTLPGISDFAHGSRPEGNPTPGGLLNRSSLAAVFPQSQEYPPGYQFPPLVYVRVAYSIHTPRLSSGEIIRVSTPHGPLIFNQAGYYFEKEKK